MVGKVAHSEWLQLQPRPDYGGHTAREWEAAAIERGLLCAECKSRLPQTAGLPVDVQVSERVTPTPFGHIIGVCLYARVEFVEALEATGEDLLEGCGVGQLVLPTGHELLKDFGVGKLILPNGVVDPRYVTLSPKQVVVIRGGPQSGSRTYCGTCGWFRYFPMPWESRHLIKGTFDESRRLHASDLGDFVVRPEIWEQIPAVFKKRIRAWPLPVKDEPEDGITDFPPVWPS